MDSGAVIAGTPKVFAQLLGTLAPHLPARYRLPHKPDADPLPAGT
jgi:hypothetical protein